MEEGIITINKKGSVTLVDANNKGVNVQKVFDFSEFTPSEGKKFYNCKFEKDEQGKAIKIIIEGKEIPQNVEFIKQKEIEKEEKKKSAEKSKMLEENKFLKIPLDTRAIIDPKEVDNFYIRFNKLSEFVNDEKPSAKNFIDNLPKFDKNLISEILKKQASIIKNYQNKATIQLQTSWRMAVGLGNENVYETSMTLHHIYGIPYIPASSVKGVVRSWIITQYFGNDENGNLDLEKAECRALKNSEFCKIFGTPDKTVFKKDNKVICEAISPLKDKNGKPTEHIGEIIFFDAFPINEPKIEVDVMNSHYGDWYGDKKDNNGNQIPPTDYQNPVPVFFLTVANTSFQFMIASKKESLGKYIIGNKTIVEWLVDALKNHGIGAKTAVGYGYMQ